ncbi:MmgE/PrpD [Penicillium paradoxum]|uniref:MmgE/PrpD n=1 Tax=Penicillium paradoxum TaxID=176176 RepID=UPI002546E6BA|nr:MmgE/PrpD [Penicillium paradoxum]KAJ5795134.1 MmgE/PrpD [Penicillium paradoxum]
MAERILMNEFKGLLKEKWAHVQLHDDDIFNWDVALIVTNPDSMYYGGYFKASMTFPSNYPYAPPKFCFLKPLHHPNIYTNGKLCISILHPPGEDEMSGELASERWSPAQRVESVLISILSLLDDAEPSSPANVDAAVLLRNEPEKYRELVKADVEKSKLDIPAGFVMPTQETTVHEPAEKEDLDFWADSDVDSDVFGGSDSDDDMDQSSGSDMELDGDDSEDEPTEKKG